MWRLGQGWWARGGWLGRHWHRVKESLLLAKWWGLKHLKAKTIWAILCSEKDWIIENTQKTTRDYVEDQEREPCDYQQTLYGEECVRRGCCFNPKTNQCYRPKEPPRLLQEQLSRNVTFFWGWRGVECRGWTIHVGSLGSILGFVFVICRWFAGWWFEWLWFRFGLSHRLWEVL